MEQQKKVSWMKSSNWLVTPSPWLEHFLVLAKNPEDFNPQYLNSLITKTHEWRNSFTYIAKILLAGYMGYFLKLCMSENHSTEIHMSQGPGLFWICCQTLRLPEGDKGTNLASINGPKLKVILEGCVSWPLGCYNPGGQLTLPSRRTLPQLT